MNSACVCLELQSGHWCVPAIEPGALGPILLYCYARIQWENRNHCQIVHF